MSQLGTSVDQVVERCSITFTAGDGRCAGIEYDPGAPTTTGRSSVRHMARRDVEVDGAERDVGDRVDGGAGLP